jgi:hypothetical protein
MGSWPSDFPGNHARGTEVVLRGIGGESWIALVGYLHGFGSDQSLLILTGVCSSKFQSTALYQVFVLSTGVRRG